MASFKVTRFKINKKFEIMSKNCNLVGTRMDKDGKEELLFQPEKTSEFIGLTKDDLWRLGYVNEEFYKKSMNMVYVDLISRFGQTNWMLVKKDNQWTI